MRGEVRRLGGVDGLAGCRDESSEAVPVLVGPARRRRGARGGRVGLEMKNGRRVVSTTPSCGARARTPGSSRRGRGRTGLVSAACSAELRGRPGVGDRARRGEADLGRRSSARGVEWWVGAWVQCEGWTRQQAGRVACASDRGASACEPRGRGWWLRLFALLLLPLSSSIPPFRPRPPLSTPALQPALHHQPRPPIVHLLTSRRLLVDIVDEDRRPLARVCLPSLGRASCFGCVLLPPPSSVHPSPCSTG